MNHNWIETWLRKYAPITSLSTFWRNIIRMRKKICFGMKSSWNWSSASVFRIGSFSRCNSQGRNSWTIKKSFRKLREKRESHWMQVWWADRTGPQSRQQGIRCDEERRIHRFTGPLQVGTAKNLLNRSPDTALVCSVCFYCKIFLCPAALLWGNDLRYKKITERKGVVINQIRNLCRLQQKMSFSKFHANFTAQLSAVN